MTRNKGLLKNVEKIIEEINGNHNETLSKLSSAFFSVNRPKQPNHFLLNVFSAESSRSRKAQRTSERILRNRLEGSKIRNCSEAGV